MRRLSPLAALASAVLLWPGVAVAQPSAFIEGTHYTELQNREAVEGDIRVTEVFWYGCPHCYSLEPLISRWKTELPDDVDFERLPTAFGRAAGKPLLQAYFTAVALDVVDAVHPAIFRAMHEDNRQLNSADALAPIFTAAGVDEAEFRKTFNSFAIDNQARSAEARVRQLRVTGTPTLIVDGRWMVLNRGVDSLDELLRVVDYLIRKARRAR